MPFTTAESLKITSTPLEVSTGVLTDFDDIFLMSLKSFSQETRKKTTNVQRKAVLSFKEYTLIKLVFLEPLIVHSKVQIKVYKTLTY